MEAQKNVISLNGSIQFDEIFLVVLNFFGVRFGGFTIFKQRLWSKIPWSFFLKVSLR